MVAKLLAALVLVFAASCAEDRDPANSLTQLDSKERLGQVDQDSGSMGDAMSQPIGLTEPAQCGSCHETHYEEWRTSMHAYATKDPVFMAMLKKGIADTKGKLGQFCVQCHAPVASFKKMLPIECHNTGSLLSAVLEGVKAKSRYGGSVWVAKNAKNTALIFNPITEIKIKRLCCQWLSPPVALEMLRKLLIKYF